MRKIVFCIILILTTIVNVRAQSRDACYPGGNDQPIPDLPHPYIPGPSTTTSGGISADPNEIIGPTGFGDSIRWVSINDILNYTILFENDPEFATANAQKVDVRFTFDDKSYIKGFGLSAFGFVRTSV